jgi:hypothetical protein
VNEACTEQIENEQKTIKQLKDNLKKQTAA